MVTVAGVYSGEKLENLAPPTRTEHRLGPHYKLNHPNLP